MSSTSNFYDLLDISKDASSNDIKKAYRKLAVKHHPDKGGNEEEFKKISEAYDVLSNDEKRKQYDMFGTCDDVTVPDFHDMFETMFQGNDIFGTFFQKNVPSKPPPKDIEIPITLEEVFHGKSIKYRHYQKTFGAPVECTNCDGKGKIFQPMSFGPGIITHTMSMCPICKGNGKKSNSKIVKQEEKIIKLTIPKGVLSGQCILLRDCGDRIENDDQYGDIRVRFLYEKHSIFKVSSTNPLDLEYHSSIQLSDLWNGFSVSIPMLDGTTQHFFKKDPISLINGPLIYRVPNMGLSNLKQTGSLVLQFSIHIPNNKDSCIQRTRNEEGTCLDLCCP